MELPSPLTASILEVLKAHTYVPDSLFPAMCICGMWVENDVPGTHMEHVAAQLTAAYLEVGS